MYQRSARGVRYRSGRSIVRRRQEREGAVGRRKEEEREMAVKNVSS
jgi:hypothetical protein